MTTTLFEPERFRSPEYLAVLDGEPADLCMFIHPQDMDKLREQAVRGYPLEVCGLLIGKLINEGWQICDIRPVANLNSERAADRFQLDPCGYQMIDRELRGTDQEIVGVYHSHPDCPAKPSPTDLSGAWEGFAYPIVSICDGQAVDIRCWAVNSESGSFREILMMEKNT